MSYAHLGQIQASDYNGFVWGTTDGSVPSGVSGTFNPWPLYMTWGPGYGNSGLGQSLSSLNAAQTNPNYGELYPVTAGTGVTLPGTTVSAVQWTGLVSAINNLTYHQNVSGNLSITGVHPQSQIATITSLTSYLNSVHTNMGKGRLAAASSQAGQSMTWVSPSTATALTNTMTVSMTWGSADQARYFFNAGGRVRINISARDNSGVARSSSMAACINALGSCIIDANGAANAGFTGTAGGAVPGFTTPAKGKGYWQLGPNNSITTYQGLGSAAGSLSGVYTDDYVECGVYFGGVQGTNGDNGDQLFVGFAFNSGYASTGPGGLTPSWDTDSLNLTITATIDYFAPSTLVLGNTWGNPVVGS